MRILKYLVLGIKRKKKSNDYFVASYFVCLFVWISKHLYFDHLDHHDQCEKIINLFWYYEVSDFLVFLSLTHSLKLHNYYTFDRIFKSNKKEINLRNVKFCFVLFFQNFISSFNTIVSWKNEIFFYPTNTEIMIIMIMMMMRKPTPEFCFSSSICYYWEKNWKIFHHHHQNIIIIQSFNWLIE